MMLHVSTSLSTLHDAFAGLVEGRQTQSLPVNSLVYFLYIFFLLKFYLSKIMISSKALPLVSIVKNKLPTADTANNGA